jgi:hypothetical protein
LPDSHPDRINAWSVIEPHSIYGSLGFRRYGRGFSGNYRDDDFLKLVLDALHVSRLGTLVPRAKG